MSAEEIIFAVEEALEELREMVQDELAYHFNQEEERPGVIRLHVVREEVLPGRGCRGMSLGSSGVRGAPPRLRSES